MTIQTINLGNYANDGTGDDLRTAFEKVNANFTELSSTVAIANGTNKGTGVAIFAQKAGANLEFKTLVSTDNSLVIIPGTETVNLHSVTSLVRDRAPMLSANLRLDGNNILGPGDVQATVYGVNIPEISSLLSFLIESNQVNVDMGTIQRPTGFETSPGIGYSFDLGTLDAPASTLQINFGSISPEEPELY